MYGRTQRAITSYKPAAIGAPNDSCCPDICPVCTTSNGRQKVPCTQCGAVFYCSVKHMDMHRFRHKLECDQLMRRRQQLEQQQPGVNVKLPTLPRSSTPPKNVPVATSHYHSPPNRTTTAPARSHIRAEVSDSNEQYVAEVGRASWKVLHSIAERYPHQPNEAEKQAAKQFISSFALLYPCTKCRNHFQVLVEKYPPDVSSQSSFVLWVGFLHDQVNLILGKEPHAQAPSPPAGGYPGNGPQRRLFH
eukprot:TRINITY_DN67927_c2_g2_i1.p1 TRINITY_DN67927_c2_g2~~TRINITY_DN67927_c2_g2_i1.p1  ORF type:complete len:247 (-),score=10.79 TRINITY_DN67927_c2_g2_i1:328-1068(-)